MLLCCILQAPGTWQFSRPALATRAMFLNGLAQGFLLVGIECAVVVGIKLLQDVFFDFFPPGGVVFCGRSSFRPEI